MSIHLTKSSPEIVDQAALVQTSEQAASSRLPLSSAAITSVARTAIDTIPSSASSPLQAPIKPLDQQPPAVLNLKIGAKKVPFPIPERRRAEIPHEAQEKLGEWLKKKVFDPIKDADRVSYTPADVPRALRLFEEEYHCNWAVMKHHCSDNQVLQIVNDLRSVYLEDIFARLQTKYQGVLTKISDFGSSKLTSDRDFAFEVGSQQQTKEAEIVKYFNELFEETWHLPSAVVFDSNAYTMQYLLSATHPDIENQRAQAQGEASLLMKLRTSNPASWEIFKAETLRQISNPTLRNAKAREFSKIEAQNAHLKLLLNKEIVKIGAANLGLDIDIDKASEANINEIAAAIKLRDPSIEVRASNLLHERLKSSYRSAESQRNLLFSSIRNLEEIASAKDPSKTKFTESFNSQLNRLIIQTREMITPSNKTALDARILALENSRIPASSPNSPDQGLEVMNAFKERMAIENNIRTTHQELIQLQNQLYSYKQLNEKLAILKAKQLGLTDPKELVNNQKAIEAIQAQLLQIQAHLKVPSIEVIPEAIGKEMSALQPHLARLKDQRRELQERFGQSWDKAGAIGLEGDHLIVHMQQLNLQGMCFAQEAHAGEGAFAFVVLNLQAGKADVRTPNQYMQAFREISGYYSGHQSHSVTPHGKMIEASKYADRLFKTIDIINQRAKDLTIPPPALQETVKLERFFKAIAPFRGTGKSDTELASIVEREARASGLIEAGEPFNQSKVDLINRQMEDLSASLENWMMNLSEKERNAYY